MSYNDKYGPDTIVPTADDKNNVGHLETVDTMATVDEKGERKIGGITINAHMTAEERSTALRLANELDPGPKLFSWRHVKFLLTALVVILNSGDSGYDPTIMSSVNSMTQFHEYFGLEQASTGTGIVFVSCLYLGLLAPRLTTSGHVHHWFRLCIPPQHLAPGQAWPQARHVHPQRALHVSRSSAQVQRCPDDLTSIGAIITANSTGMPMFLGGRWLTVGPITV